MLQSSKKFLRHIYDHFEEYLGVTMITIMVLCLTLQVLARVFLGTSFAWTEELSRFTFIWTIYIAMAFAAKQNDHIRITAQFLKSSTKTRLKFRILVDIIWSIGCFFVAYQSAILIQDAHAFPEISATLKIVKTWVEIIIPICFILIPFRIAEGYYIHYKSNTLYSLVDYEKDGAV